MVGALERPHLAAISWSRKLVDSTASPGTTSRATSRSFESHHSFYKGLDS